MAGVGSTIWFRSVLQPLPQDEILGLEDVHILEIAAPYEAPLPATYQNFLRVAGRRGSDLWRGSDMFFPSVATALADCSEIAAAGAGSFVLPERAVVLGHHQGYMFDFLVGPGDNPPVFRFSEGEDEATQVSESFTDFVEASVQSALAGVARSIAHQRQTIEVLFKKIAGTTLAPSRPTGLAELVEEVSAGGSGRVEELVDLCVHRAAQKDLDAKERRNYERLGREAMKLQRAIARYPKLA